MYYYTEKIKPVCLEEYYPLSLIPNSLARIRALYVHAAVLPYIPVTL